MREKATIAAGTRVFGRNPTLVSGACSTVTKPQARTFECSHPEQRHQRVADSQYMGPLTMSHGVSLSKCMPLMGVFSR